MSRSIDPAYMMALVMLTCKVHRTERLKAQADERRKLWEASKA